MAMMTRGVQNSYDQNGILFLSHFIHDPIGKAFRHPPTHVLTLAAPGVEIWVVR